MKLVNSLAVLSFLAFAGTAYAQTPAAAPAAPAATAPAPAAAMKSAKPRSAKSLDCSKQADTQKLHGKPRKEFMSKCKKS
ncbi:PsiF family protein [Rhodoblastus sp.]|uniref:PsiF family protein n=1 Tax=Rhodoblastus sp. TaxID=1962975 RepID=UPI003F994694